MTERTDEPDLKAGMRDEPERTADGLILRLARESDAEALIEFNRAMARETEELELPAETLTAGVLSLLQTPEYGFYIVADHADGDGGARASVGSLMVTYEWSDWRDGLFWWIQSVYVRPEYRRRGIYRRLYEFVKRLAAREPNVRGFRLYVEQENLIAQQTYERLGMKASHYRMYEETL